MALTGCQWNNFQNQSETNSESFTIIEKQDKILHQYSKGVHNLFLAENGKTKNITNFKPWENIEDFELSPDGKKLFVWHKSYQDEAYQLSTYDLTQNKIITSIYPGFGGSFYWNSGSDRILHLWGCGSDCGQFEAYNEQLEEIFSVSGTGIIISPNKEKFVSYPTLYAAMEPLQIWEIKSGKILKSFSPNNKEPYVAYDIEFAESNKIKFTYDQEQLNIKEKTVEIIF